MKRIRRILAACAAVALALMGNAMADESDGISIRQIDTARLLAEQRVRAFVTLRGDGRAIDAESVTVEESTDGKDYKKARIRSIAKDANRNEGISFYLLLDNSGSMWDDLDGKKTSDPDSTRMSHAKRAIVSFSERLAPKDRIALSEFNSGFARTMAISSDAGKTDGAVSSITRPEREMGYTELYGSIETALREFGEEGRRKALLILSDGEHMPPPGSESRATVDADIEAAITEGVTCYVVNFGSSPDNLLPRLARESGGAVFNARDAQELYGIYESIRQSILDEYAIDYEASMAIGDRRYARITYEGNARRASDERQYYAGAVLGYGRHDLSYLHLLAVLIPLILWVALILFKLERDTSEAGIRLLYGAAGERTRVFTLGGAQTIIGGADTCDITIAGNPSLKDNAATIAFDEGKKRYTIAAQSDLTVNNRPVKTKILEPGDVINMAGTVVVFEDKQRKE